MTEPCFLESMAKLRLTRKWDCLRSNFVWKFPDSGYVYATGLLKRVAQRIDHFIVACLVAWPLNESVMLCYVNDDVLKLISTNLHKKSNEVSIKTRSPPASFSFKGQATKRTTLEWSISANKKYCYWPNWVEAF